MVFDALMMGLASIFRIVDMQRDRERLDHERIAVLDANVQLLERFRRLEQKHQLAQSLAETSNQLLVDTTHDLRQPLFALRSSISDLASGAKPRTSIKEIEQSFDYIEELVGTTLEQAIDRDEAGADVKTDDKEVIDVQQVLSSLENMFREDAEKAVGAIDHRAINAENSRALICRAADDGPILHPTPFVIPRVQRC